MKRDEGLKVSKELSFEEMLTAMLTPEEFSPLPFQTLWRLEYDEAINYGYDELEDIETKLNNVVGYLPANEDYVLACEDFSCQAEKFDKALCRFIAYTSDYLYSFELDDIQHKELLEYYYDVKYLAEQVFPDAQLTPIYYCI